MQTSQKYLIDSFALPFKTIQCKPMTMTDTPTGKDLTNKNSQHSHIQNILDQTENCIGNLTRPRQWGNVVSLQMYNHCPGLKLFQLAQYITKTRLYNFDPIKPHFYIVKLGFTGVYIIFLISVQNIDCGYSLEPPLRGGSNEYLQSIF